tara:strand:+ start:19756 stop:20829 length:1074 start_codon:yes stop_codon:yes gene_type:complete
MPIEKHLILGSRDLTKDSKPYIIAEIGVNHEGSLEKAKELIDLAKEGGADAVKFQTYKAEKLASKNSPAYWDTSKEKIKSQFQLFKKYDNFQEKDYLDLAAYSKDRKIDFLSTPFDLDAIDFLNELVPFFKVASADINNLPFLRKIASKGKPVIISTGASSIIEINYAIEVLKMNGCEDIGILHCILNYPTNDQNACLKMIKNLQSNYPNYLIGYSDHTLPDQNMLPLITAYLTGAIIIEKHFTFDKTLPGNDHYHAMDKNDLQNFVKLASKAHSLLGVNEIKEPIPSESISIKNARRSIVSAHFLKKNQIITEKDLICKRPGFGISPIYWDKIIGMKTIKDIEEDHIIEWDDLNNI